jgi:hypothetical protein
MCEGLDEDSGLNGHVETPSNASALEGLVSRILGTGCHQTRHFILSKINLLAPKSSEGEVCDLELSCWSRHFCGVASCGVGWGLSGNLREDEVL